MSDDLEDLERLVRQAQEDGYHAVDYLPNDGAILALIERVRRAEAAFADVLDNALIAEEERDRARRWARVWKEAARWYRKRDADTFDDAQVLYQKLHQALAIAREEEKAQAGQVGVVAVRRRIEELLDG